MATKNEMFLENMIQYQFMQCTSNRKKYEVLAFSDGLRFKESIQELSDASQLI